MNDVGSFVVWQDGTDTVFRNVGYQTPYAGEQPKRLHTTYRTRRKLEIKKYKQYFYFLFFSRAIRANEGVFS
jgi:plasmid stabilization system protein ParE